MISGQNLVICDDFKNCHDVVVDACVNSIGSQSIPLLQKPFVATSIEIDAARIVFKMFSILDTLKIHF